MPNDNDNVFIEVWLSVLVREKERGNDREFVGVSDVEAEVS